VALGCPTLVEKSRPASTREPTDAALQGDDPLDPSLLNGKRVDFNVFDLSGISVGADFMIVDPTAPCYGSHCTLLSGYDDAQLLRKINTMKHEKHDLSGATIVPLVMTSFGKLGPAGEGHSQSLATIAWATGELLTVACCCVLLDST
jgi:hypothetical protein